MTFLPVTGVISPGGNAGIISTYRGIYLIKIPQ